MRKVSMLDHSEISDPSNIASEFLTSFSTILNKHASEYKNIYKKPKTFELNQYLKSQFKIRDKLYERYLSTGDDTYLSKYRKMSTDLKTKVRKRKDDFIKNRLENSADFSTLWQIFDSIELTSTIYPSQLQLFSASEINIFFSKINMYSPPCLIFPH